MAFTASDGGGAGGISLFPSKMTPYKSAGNTASVASTTAPTKISSPTISPKQLVTAPVTGFDSGSGTGAPAAPPAPPVLSEADFLAGDSTYQAQLAALLKALTNEQADNTAQQSKYNVDYNSALKNLGFTSTDNPATTDVHEGTWNFGDQNTAAGRAFQNQQNDFAGRGMLQSSLFGTANDNLTRSLADQLAGIDTAKGNFMSDLARQGTAFAGDNTVAQQQAKAEALGRRAAGISL